MSDVASRLVVRALAPSLGIRIATEVRRHDAGRAVRDHHVKIFVCWDAEESEVDLAALAELVHVGAENAMPEVASGWGPLEIAVGRAEYATVDLAVPTCWEELARRPDLRIVGQALHGEALDCRELNAAYEVPSARVLVAIHLEIAPRWQGAEYGLLAMELALRELGRGADIAALFPMQPGVQDLAQRDAASIRLAKYWRRAGFEEFNGIMARALA